MRELILCWNLHLPSVKEPWWMLPFSSNRRKYFDGYTERAMNWFPSTERHKTVIWSTNKKTLSSIDWSLFFISQLLSQWNEQCYSMGTSLPLRVCQGKKAISIFLYRIAVTWERDPEWFLTSMINRRDEQNLSERGWRCILRQKVWVARDHLE